MLTNNYKKMAMYHVLGCYSNGAYVQQQVTGFDGVVCDTYPPKNTISYLNFLGYHLSNPSCTSIYHGLSGAFFGDGNTAPTADDYNLSGNLIAGLSFQTTLSGSQENDGVRMTAVYRITNNNSNAVTISEVGVFGSGFKSDGSKTKTILLERSVLDYPVTIEAGGFGDVTYEIKVYYPT